MPRGRRDQARAFKTPRYAPGETPTESQSGITRSSGTVSETASGRAGKDRKILASAEKLTPILHRVLLFYGWLNRVYRPGASVVKFHCQHGI
jgi:hypothetical protein